MEGVHISFQPTAEETAAIKEQLKQVDTATLERLRALVRGGGTHCSADEIAPFKGVTDISDVSEATNEQWRQTGLKLIGAGKIACLLLAGGQGTRLGFDHPKGMYNLGLPSAKTLFELQAERITSLQNMTGGKIPWYVLTSDATHEDTKKYFEEKAFFGLGKENVFLFQQGMLPSLDSEGKILLESRSKVSLAPNGNAGVYQALDCSGALKDMEKRGIEFVHQYAVDNVLVRVCDPLFVGFMAEVGADVAAKVVPKSHPDEAVGVLCMRDGKPAVAEYSELDHNARHLRDPTTGRLIYSASHICVNAFSLAFLKANAHSPLPFHIAFKKVPHVSGPNGEVVTPKDPNAYKAEMFIFDAFAYAKKMAALQVPRIGEFSPLKNAPGSKADCPETCRADIFSLHRSWLEAAGVKVEGEAGLPCEVSPLVSYGGEGLKKFAGRTIKLPFHLASSD